MVDQKSQVLFVIGPQRSGTTWVYSFLQQQPDGVYLDRLEKENYHFARSSNRKPSVNRSWLLSRITGAKEVRLCADVCSTYFGHPEAIERILASFPEAKFAYIDRDEESRRKSFSAHRRFNVLSSWILGYKISWKLYERQADFDGFEAWIKKRVPEDRTCVLKFDDLSRDGGEIWISQLEQLTGIEFASVNMGVVNKSRSAASNLRRILFVGVRLLQAMRVHIFIKRAKLWFKGSEFRSAKEGGVL
jgi:hypothetical protein